MLNTITLTPYATYTLSGNKTVSSIPNGDYYVYVTYYSEVTNHDNSNEDKAEVALTIDGTKVKGTSVDVGAWNKPHIRLTWHGSVTNPNTVKLSANYHSCSSNSIYWSTPTGSMLILKIS